MRALPGSLDSVQTFILSMNVVTSRIDKVHGSTFYLLDTAGVSS